MKRTLIFFVLCCVILTLLGNAGMATGVPVSSPLLNESETTYGEYLGDKNASVRGTGYFIFKGYSAISQVSSGKVFMEGFTHTFSTVEYLSGRIYLQKWTGTTWVNIDNRLFTNYNHFHTSGGKVVNVQPGYYRVRGIHYAENNGMSETRHTTTPYFYID